MENRPRGIFGSSLLLGGVGERALSKRLDSLARGIIPTSTHYALLQRLALGRGVVAELGTHLGNSAIALLSGLPKSVITVDRIERANRQLLEDLALENSVELAYLIVDSLQVRLPKVELLFLDTKHTYSQVSRELERHQNSVERYLVIHDTELYGRVGESADPEDYLQGTVNGRPEGHDPDDPGVMLAIEEFLRANSDWTLCERDRGYLGYVVLERRELEVSNG